MNKRLFWFFWTTIIVGALFLRLYGLNRFPPSLYWEEAALGYDAYSILRTGKDHHGHSFPLIAFESFGDWKPSGYFYAIVPFISLFGLNLWAVRLPSVVAGIMLVIGMGELVNLFFREELSKKKRQGLQLMAMTVTAISPWAIQFSRAGWEVNLATALILSGALCFLQATEASGKKQFFLIIVSVMLWVGSMYTYHAARIIAPLLGLLFGIWWLARDRGKHTKPLMVAGVVGFVLVFPLLFSLRSKSTNQRFAETSIFSDLSVIEESNLRKQRAGNSLLSRLIYHRYVLFSREILKNGLSHFNPEFLFVSGDQNARHSIQYVGQLYHLEALLLFFGLGYLLIHRRPKYLLLLGWLIIGIFPAAITKAAPHALRILPTLPIFLVIISLGIYQLKQWLPKMIMPLLIALYVGELVVFWRFYSSVYPKMYASEWQYGYEQLIAIVSKAKENEPQLPVYITREQGRPAMYYWFFNQTDPRLVQSANETSKRDQGEFLEFNGIKFINSISEIVEDNAVIASSPDQQEVLNQIQTDNSPTSGIQMIEAVDDPQGKVIWSVYRLKAVTGTGN